MKSHKNQMEIVGRVCLGTTQVLVAHGDRVVFGNEGKFDFPAFPCHLAGYKREFPAICLEVFPPPTILKPKM